MAGLASTYNPPAYVPVNSKAKSLKDLKGLVFANKKGTSTDFST